MKYGYQKNAREDLQEGTKEVSRLYKTVHAGSDWK